MVRYVKTRTGKKRADTTRNFPSHFDIEVILETSFKKNKNDTCAK
eukprot:jgi/Antlo1/1566/1681